MGSRAAGNRDSTSAARQKFRQGLGLRRTQALRIRASESRGGAAQPRGGARHRLKPAERLVPYAALRVVHQPPRGGKRAGCTHPNSRALPPARARLTASWNSCPDIWRAALVWSDCGRIGRSPIRQLLPFHFGVFQPDISGWHASQGPWPPAPPGSVDSMPETAGLQVRRQRRHPSITH